MKPLEKIKEKIRKHIEKHEGGKPYRLSVDSGLHRNTLNGWNKPEWNPEYSTLAAVDAQIDGGCAHSRKRIGRSSGKNKTSLSCTPPQPESICRD